MDILEYTTQRMVITDGRSFIRMLIFGSFGAGLILLASWYITPNYYPFSFLLFILSGLILYLSDDETFCTFDREEGKFEIQRNPMLGKTSFELYDLDHLKEVRTATLADSKRLSYRIEFDVASKGWIPMTHAYQHDQYGFESLEKKIRTFLDQA